MRDNSRKHIIYVTPSFPYGPSESFIKPELHAWLDLGYFVTVIPIWPRGELTNKLSHDSIEYLDLPVFTISYLKDCISYMLYKPVQFIKLVSILITKPSMLLKNLVAFIKGCAISARINSIQPIHIHAHFAGTSSTMAMVISAMTNIPWSMTCHRWDIYENNLLAVKSKYTLFTRFISKAGMADGIKLGVDPVKSVYIPMGVRTINVESARTLGNSVPVIMCAANLIEVKGHKYLLGAISELKSVGFKIVLKIAGDGPLKAELKELAQRLKIDDQVHFIGHISHADLLSMYSDNLVDLFVLPSIDLGNGLHEGVPVSLMEAMCYGIPVISTKTGSIEELLDPSFNMTVPDKNSSALATAIKEVLSNKKNYSEKSRQVINCINSNWLIHNSVIKMKNYIDGF